MAGPHNVHVLVADDDDDIRELVSFKLARGGYRVSSVSDGAAAWQAFQADTPEVVILDVQMPNLSGLEVLRKIRASGHAAVPVLMLSARSRDSDVAGGLAAGADDYLIKPLNPRELASRVKDLLA